MGPLNEKRKECTRCGEIRTIGNWYETPEPFDHDNRDDCIKYLKSEIQEIKETLERHSL